MSNYILIGRINYNPEDMGANNMFRANDSHNQAELFNSTSWMDPKIQKKLAGSWAPLFYEHVFRNIDEAPFAVLYDGYTGRPNFPVNVLMGLEYIKHIRCCSDEELLDAFSFDYQVNYALGMRTLGETNLDGRTLSNFRERVYRHCLDNPGEGDLIFGQFVGLASAFADAAGVLLDKQRTDTTMFQSNIKKAGRISLAYDVLVKAVKAIPEGLRTEALRQALEPGFKTDVLYRAKASEGDGKLATLLNLCQEALQIIDGQEGLLESDERRILGRFIDEQSVAGAEGGRLAPKPNKDITSGSLQSAHDEDATYRKKGGTGQSGYVLEVSETCNKDNPFQLATDYSVKPNNVSDQEIFLERLPAIKENTGCKEQYVDGGFHSPEVHQAAAAIDIEIHLTDMCGTEPANKIPVTEFDIDAETNVIGKCPAGHAPARAGVCKSQTVAHFPHEVCANCGLRGQCYSKEQKKDCVVRLSLTSVGAGREREKMKAGKKESTSMRAGIEGTNSALKRKGQDKLDVRGIAKCTIVSGLKVTCQNIKRLIKFMQGGYKTKQTKPAAIGTPMPICG
jgi:hypothetical protein